MVIKEGHSSYGYCWVEKQGNYFFLYLMDGKEKRGPYMNLGDVLSEFSKYCPQ